MLSRLFLCTACAALIAAPAFAKDKPAPSAVEPVVCEGVYGIDSSEDLLIDTFGEENVHTGFVDGPEGTQYIATTVYPGDPEREMIFSWFDEDRLEKPSFIELSPSQAGPHGVRLGMSVAEVEAINGQAFDIGGFWWDYGGSAPIEEGTLAGPQSGDCYVSVSFSPQDDIPASIDVTPVSGEVVVRSDLPLLAEIGTRVTSLSLGYALDPEE
nr:hypothetical protein [uncultured Devosia sp.]